MWLGSINHDRRDLGWCSRVTSTAPHVSPRILDWFHISMKLRAIRSSLYAYNYFSKRPEIMQRSERLLVRVRDALWRGRGGTAIEMLRTLAASLAIAAEELTFFYRLASGTAYRATLRLLTFLEHNRKDLVDYQRARMEGRSVSAASAESVMNHLINRRLSKRQQMRYAMKGASLSTTDPQKLRPASPHWMRHTHATHALAHGAELTIVRDNLRHASISTASIYHRAMTRGGRSRSPGRLGTDECRERRWPAIRSLRLDPAESPRPCGAGDFPRKM
jgi:hypothetical protein